MDACRPPFDDAVFATALPTSLLFVNYPWGGLIISVAVPGSPPRSNTNYIVERGLSGQLG
jgi:hypothetical protein